MLGKPEFRAAQTHEFANAGAPARKGLCDNLKDDVISSFRVRRSLSLSTTE